MEKKKIIFAILLVIFVAVLVYDTGITGRDRAARPEKEKNTQMSSLNIDLFDRKPFEYPGVKRDLFSPPVLKYTRITPVNKPAPLPQAVISQPPIIPQPVMPQAPPPPPESSALQMFASQAKFMGFLEKSDNRTAFILKGPEVLTMKKGDIIERRFKVESVSASEVFFLDNLTGEKTRLLLKP